VLDWNTGVTTAPSIRGLRDPACKALVSISFIASALYLFGKDQYIERLYDVQAETADKRLNCRITMTGDLRTEN
jgi:hypothetical protein